MTFVIKYGKILSYYQNVTGHSFTGGLAMNDFFRISVVMEMLIVNLFTVDICAERKYSRLKSYSTLVIFTFILTSFTKDIWAYIGFDKGNAAFAMIGIIYLLPLSFLYQESLLQLMSVLFSAWIYTMFIFCFSARLACFWPEQQLVGRTLVIQSLLYAVTLSSFLHWVRKGFLFVMSNIARSSRYILQIVSLSWFISMIIIQANLIYTGNPILQVISITILGADSILSYLLIYSTVKNQKEVQNLERIVYVDDLTKLSNRSKLFKDLPVLIEKGNPFRLIFMDLNRFKSVNDQYGHAMGDRYLIQFSLDTIAMLGPEDQMYRMSGDEFVIVTTSKDRQRLIDKLNHYPDTLHGLDIPFLGLSLGWSDFPDEQTSPDKLISLADHRMYQTKPVYDRE